MTAAPTTLLRFSSPAEGSALPSAPKRANVTHSKKDPGTSMSPGSRTTEMAAVLTIQRHAKTHQQPTAWPGYDCMGWEYDPLYDGLEWPPQHIRSAYRNIGPA